MGSLIHAQTSKADLLGTWYVKNVSYNNKESTAVQKQRLESMKKMFLKTTFVFRNNNVDFNFPSQEIALKNGTWKFEMENVICINKGKEKFMKFFIENKNNKTYFILSDFEFPYLILEVEK